MSEPGVPPSDQPLMDEGVEPPGPGRRRFVALGMAAAGAAAATVVAGAGAAEANNGDALVIGAANTGTNTTTLTGSRIQLNHVSDDTTVITASSTGDDGMGVLGLASGTTPNGIGVKGQGRTGVVGDGNYPSGIGVSGFGPTGVKGQSPNNGGAGVLGVATGPGAFGVSGSGVTGVKGESTTSSGVGVSGIASGLSSTGVAGTGASTGVYGEGEQTAIAAFSNGGDGFNSHTDGPGKRAVVAESDGGGGIGVEIDAQFGPALRLKPGPVMPPAAGTWEAGDIVMNAGLWLCIVGGVGSASKWAKLSRTYQPLAVPVRIYDSRPGNAPLGVTKGVTVIGGERVIDATVGGKVPAGIASAVEVNVTVTETDATGWLSLFANGVSWPGTSTINWFQPGSIVANSVTVAVDANARFRVRAAGVTHMVFDVTGYYT